MVKVDNLSKIGIGTYRMSAHNNFHLESLHYGIQQGINILDTASNYMHGDSEKLIAKLWPEISRKDLFIVTKAGYIPKSNQQMFEDALQDDEKLNYFSLSETLKYSIDPAYIKRQLAASLERMKTDYLDLFLLHNPEYYLSAMQKSKLELYSDIRKAFACLEELRTKNKIRFFGISSSLNLFNFPLILLKIMHSNLMVIMPTIYFKSVKKME